MNKQTYLCIIVLLTSTIISANPFSKNTAKAMAYSDIQRVRIDFTMPTGYIKHLLLGFTPNNAASDGVDYGYDALSIDDFPDDLNWIIEEESYVIQGVGAFNSSNQYPLGMFISNAGDISISLDTLENFETDIDVFLFDSLYNTYTLLTEIDFQEYVNEGTYLNRYFISFGNNTNGTIYDNSTMLLAVDENNMEETSISFLRQTKEIYIHSNQNISKLEIYNLLGKRILNKEHVNTKTLRLPTTRFTNQAYGIVRVYSNEGVTNKKLLFK